MHWGKRFFSLSLGVGTMMVYGSYISKADNLPRLGATVAVVDIGIAVLAGLLVIPAMYVALHNGVTIFDDAGALIDSDRLIFTVLPALFETMGFAGIVISVLFFILMTIAAITSSISMLEVPVAYVSESWSFDRRRASMMVGAGIMMISFIIIFNFEALFGFVINLTTRYSEPLIGLLFCLFVGWVMHRNHLLEELKQGSPDLENGLFWKIWPSYVRFVCPLVMLGVFMHSFGLLSF